MRLPLGRFTPKRFVAEPSPDQLVMKDFALKRRVDEIVVLAFMLALFGLGALSSLLGAMATGDAAQFWQTFLGGIALLAVMTMPIWFVQRWQATARPAVSPEGIRAFNRTRLALIALWLFGLGIAVVGLAINFQANASFEAILAVGLLIAYMAGWALLVFLTLRRPTPLAARPRIRWLGARFR